MKRKPKDLPQLLRELPNVECKRAAQLLHDWAESKLDEPKWPPTTQDGGFSVCVPHPGLRDEVTLFQVVVAHRRKHTLGWLIIPWKEGSGNRWESKLGKSLAERMKTLLTNSGIPAEDEKKGSRVPLEPLANATAFSGFTRAAEEVLVLLGAQGTDPSTGQTLAEEEPEEENEKEPRNDEEGINWRKQLVKARLGQGRFRQQVLKAYGGRCAISGCTVEPALAAAHILPCVANGSTHSVSNGLLLRSDLHLLFDQNLIAIDPLGPKVVVASALQQTEYGKLHNKLASLPQDGHERMRSVLLDKHIRELGS